MRRVAASVMVLGGLLVACATEVPFDPSLGDAAPPWGFGAAPNGGGFGTGGSPGSGGASAGGASAGGTSAGGASAGGAFGTGGSQANGGSVGSGGSFGSGGSRGAGGGTGSGGGSTCNASSCPACLFATPCCKPTNQCGCSLFGLPCG
ncbi:MAG TPA: hypothetical protein VHE30_18080 [Polyangiaceae bacterium]|nr:hypothetical protein [Polyangiaceae bacterium]